MVIKDHMNPTRGGDSQMSQYDSVILLVRNPYNAHIAEFNREQSNSKRGHAANEAFLSRGENFNTTSI